MPYKWLQVRGHPVAPAFLFAQQRTESYFDPHIDRLHEIVRALLVGKGVFNIRIHYYGSSVRDRTRRLGMRRPIPFSRMSTRSRRCSGP